MWSSNTIPQHSNSSSKITPNQEQQDQKKASNLIYPQIYKTPIKQSFIPQISNTPFHFDLNLYLNNINSSGNYPRLINFSQSGQSNKDIFYKQSVDNSGLKLTPSCDLNNAYISNYNYYFNPEELNNSENTKKNLNEVFNKAKNEEFLQQQKHKLLFGKFKNNKKSICSNLDFKDKTQKLTQNILISPNLKNKDKLFISSNEKEKIANKLNHVTKLIDNLNKENICKNKDKKNKDKKENLKIKNKSEYKKNIILNNENDDKTEFMFNTPVDKKKPKKLFECSGSTMNTDIVKLPQKKRRFRKNNEQLKLLSEFYEENKQWTKIQIQNISNVTGLKENKVYKWLWDQRNKEYKSAKFVVNKNDE